MQKPAAQGHTQNRATCVCAALFGSLFFVALLLHGYLDRLQDAGNFGPLWGLCSLAGGTAAALGYAAAAARCRQKADGSAAPVPAGGSARFFVLCTAGLFAAWLPVWLAYWPGLFNYDAAGQTSQVLSGAYSTQHPLLHTWLLGLSYRLGTALGDQNLGVALYVLPQMLVLAAAIAYMLLFLRALGWRRWQLALVWLFFAVMPFVPVLAISMTKDILFSSALLVLFVQLCRALREPQLLGRRGYRAGYLVLAVLMSLLRGNGIYALLALLLGAAAVAVFRKPLRRLAVLTALALVLAFASGKALAAGFRAQSYSVNDMLSLPYQQMAAVYTRYGETLSAQDRADIEYFVPAAWRYTPYLADDIKATGRAGEAPAAFVVAWGRLALRYPGTYAAALLRLTQGYWDICDTTHARIYGDNLAERQGYLQTIWYKGYGIELAPRLPALEQLYEQLFSANRYLAIPLLHYLLCPALYMWLILLGVCCAWERRDCTLLPALALLLGLIATILAGPCCLIRYALPYILCVPPLWAMLLRPAAAQDAAPAVRPAAD